MGRVDWTKWLTEKNLESYHCIEYVGYRDGYFTVILTRADDQLTTQKVRLVWEHIYSYTVSNESYREDLWISDTNTYWPFYRLETSSYISGIKLINTLLQDVDILHFIIIGEDVVDILSSFEPIIEVVSID